MTSIHSVSGVTSVSHSALQEFLNDFSTHCHAMLTTLVGQENFQGFQVCQDFQHHLSKQYTAYHKTTLLGL